MFSLINDIRVLINVSVFSRIYNRHWNKKIYLTGKEGHVHIITIEKTPQKNIALEYNQTKIGQCKFNQFI